MKTEQISETAWQVAVSFKPFIDRKCKEVDLIVEDFAKTIQMVIDLNKNEFSESDIINAVKLARKLPNIFLSTDILDMVKDLKK